MFLKDITKTQNKRSLLLKLKLIILIISNESLTEDGWFKTGDIGKLNTDGTFSIIDRKKSMVNIFKIIYIVILFSLNYLLVNILRKNYF